jgi:release factor glutamine methyltransferase
MSVSPSPRHRSVIVARLRAAGCVFAEDEARLLISAARTPDGLAAMVDRRAAGVPLEHVLGWAEFCGLRIAVDPGVFVPRRRTEFLVGQAVSLVRQAAGPGGPRPVVVTDLCCGSGAVGAALAAALDRVELHAADLDPAAVACARRNVAPAGGRVYEGDLYQPLPATLRGRVDVLAANVPYVPAEEVGLLPPEARMHEPRLALDGGADGLDVLRRVAAAAPQWLAPGGHLLAETSERQAPRAVGIVAESGLIPRLASSDELNATVVIGTRPGPQSQSAPGAAAEDAPEPPAPRSRRLAMAVQATLTPARVSGRGAGGVLG